MVAESLEILLQEWADKRHLAPSPRDADGRSFLVFDGLYEVALSQLGDQIYLEADLGPVPPRRDLAESLFEKLMALQLSRAGTEAQVLSVTNAGTDLTIFEVLSARQTDLAAFDRRLGAFVNAVAVFTRAVAPDEGATPQLPERSMQMLFP